MENLKKIKYFFLLDQKNLGFIRNYLNFRIFLLFMFFFLLTPTLNSRFLLYILFCFIFFLISKVFTNYYFTKFYYIHRKFHVKFLLFVLIYKFFFRNIVDYLHIFSNFAQKNIVFNLVLAKSSTFFIQPDEFFIYNTPNAVFSICNDDTSFSINHSFKLSVDFEEDSDGGSVEDFTKNITEYFIDSFNAEFVDELANFFEEDSDEYSKEDCDADSGEDSGEDFEEDFEENSEEDSEEDFEEDSDEDSEEDSEEDFEEDSDEDSDEDSEEDSDGDFNKDYSEDSNKNFEVGSDEY